MKTRLEAAEAVAVARHAIANYRMTPSFSIARANAMLAVIMIGDTLARELVCSVESLDHLLSKWTDHHYRPTLRGDAQSLETALANVYDLVAEARGMTMKTGKFGITYLTAYRG